MAGLSKFAESLPEGYGYVVFTAVGSTFVNMWMAMKVGAARKKYEVQYPIMYSSENGGDNVFNCIQRAHQNTLENYPQFLMLLFLGGLQYPKIGAAAGGCYLIGRILYARGYYSGEPRNRRYGAVGYLGLLTLLGSAISLGAHQLRWC